MSSHLRPLSFGAVGLLTAAIVLSGVGLGVPMWYTVHAKAAHTSGLVVTVTLEQGLFKTCTKSHSSSKTVSQCADFPKDTSATENQPACSDKPKPTVGTVVARIKTAQAFGVMNVVTLGLLWLYRIIPTLFPVLASTNETLFSQRRQCIATICLTLLSLVMAVIALACFYGTFNVCTTSYCDGQKQSISGSYSLQSWSCGPGASFICLIIEAAVAMIVVGVAGVHYAKSPLVEPPAPLHLTDQHAVPIVDHPTGVQLQQQAQEHVPPYQQLLQQHQQQHQQQQHPVNAVAAHPYPQQNIQTTAHQDDHAVL